MAFLMQLFDGGNGYIKKKMLSTAFVFFFLLLCASCGKQQEDVKQEEDVKQQDDVKQENIEENTEETEEKKDKLAGYGEITERERFGSEEYFEIIGDVEHKEAPEPYSNTNEDGSFLALMWLTGGTPYDVAGAIYDHDMFAMQVYAKRESVVGNYTGGGETTYLYQFTPSHPGDAEIVMLYKYLTDDVYEGTIYNITVEDDLRCRWNWSGRVVQGENLEVFEEN